MGIKFRLLSLSNSVAYNILKTNHFDVIKVFPPIRVWGTIGFIVAMWVTNLRGNKASANQFYIAAAVAVVLGVYSFSLPKCPPLKSTAKGAPLVEALGLSAFKLFGNLKLALFFIFTMFLGGALQLTNMYGDVFISEFAAIPKYSGSLVVKYSTLIMSISQVEKYFTINGTKDWHHIWLSFALYALVIAIGFAFLFKHQHDPKAVENVRH